MKTQSHFKTIVAATVVLVYSIQLTYSQDANQILKKSDEVTYAAKDQKSTVKITLTNKAGKQETREALMLQKGNEKRMFRFTAPASQAGIAFLSLPDDVIYLYLPAFGKERRIASHVKNQTFAGTDFSYDEMESKPMADKYNPKLISSDGNSFVLELTPKPGQKTDYLKLIATFNKTTYYIEKVEFYDKAGKKAKEMVNKKTEKKGNYIVATEIEMTDLKKNHSTTMTMTSISFDNNLSDDEFTVRKLKQ